MIDDRGLMGIRQLNRQPATDSVCKKDLLLFFAFEKDKINIYPENGQVGNDHRNRRKENPVYDKKKTTYGINRPQPYNIPHKERE